MRSLLSHIRPVHAIALLGVLGLASLAACTTPRVQIVESRGPVATPPRADHSAFDAVLRTYVADGLVDYAGLKASSALTPYLRQLAATDPAALPEKERLAFWINAYNALTLKLIVDNYPTASILRLAPVGVKGLPFVIPQVNTPFKQDVGIVGGQVRSLDEIEHAIIRTEFDEPRIHFALVCAALSCPPLRGEAYTGDRLDAQLDDQARAFLTDPAKNRIPDTDGAIALSKIFKWFEEDFGEGNAAVQSYLARYFEGEAAEKLTAGAFAVRYTSYDWSLNDRAMASGPIPSD